jgi:hypothetical protein
MEIAEEERDVLYLEALVDQQRLQDLAALSKELAAKRREVIPDEVWFHFMKLVADADYTNAIVCGESLAQEVLGVQVSQGELVRPTLTEELIRETAARVLMLWIFI